MYLSVPRSVASRPLFPFQQAQYAQVFPLKPAPFCKLCWSRRHQQVCHFSSLLSDSRFFLTTLSSPPFFLLLQSLWQELSSPISCFIRLQWAPDTCFSGRTTRLLSLPEAERYLYPRRQSRAVSPLSATLQDFQNDRLRLCFSIFKLTWSSSARAFLR